MCLHFIWWSLSFFFFLFSIKWTKNLTFFLTLCIVNNVTVNKLCGLKLWTLHLWATDFQDFCIFVWSCSCICISLLWSFCFFCFFFLWSFLLSIYVVIYLKYYLLMIGRGSQTLLRRKQNGSLKSWKVTLHCWGFNIMFDWINSNKICFKFYQFQCWICLFFLYLLRSSLF